MKLFNDLKRLYCSPDELEVGDFFYCWTTNTHYRVLSVNGSSYVTIECIETGWTTPAVPTIDNALEDILAHNADFDPRHLTKVKPNEVYMIFSRK